MENESLDLREPGGWLMNMFPTGIAVQIDKVRPSTIQPLTPSPSPRSTGERGAKNSGSNLYEDKTFSSAQPGFAEGN